jgi:monoamine oxidase
MAFFKLFSLIFFFLMELSCAESSISEVVVIGGGLAGLTVAHRLLLEGIDVHLYEARNRVGGRIFTAKVGGCIAELGGGHISDGGNAENIHRLVAEFALELRESKRNFSYFYFTGGNLIPGEELLKHREFDPIALKSQLLAIYRT